MIPFAAPPVAVIAGSSFYSLLEHPSTLTIDTPYGSPSADVTIAEVRGRQVAFLPRHGTANEHPPHRVNYRANVWALRAVGARQILAASTASSLHDAIESGTFVVPDQLVDRTTNRISTFIDHGIVHAPFADPYCGRLRQRAITGRVVDGGTLVVIDGPRFSTRAEAQWLAAQGWTMLNMTGHPEAVLARELGLCYATIVHVANHDAGLSSGQTREETTAAQFAEGNAQLYDLLSEALSEVEEVSACSCSSWLSRVRLPFALP